LIKNDRICSYILYYLKVSIYIMKNIECQDSHDNQNYTGTEYREKIQRDLKSSARFQGRSFFLQAIRLVR
jgi:hypothetical protein